MASSLASSAIGCVQTLNLTNGTTSSVTPQSAFLGTSLKKAAAAASTSCTSSKAVVVRAASEDEKKETKKVDRWAGLGTDQSDDQQDITRGKGMVDALFQGAVGMGTQHAVLSSWEYISQGQRFLSMDNIKDGYYIAPAFMDKLVVHISKNFMNLPNIKVPLILGIWGGKGQGKSFQCELVFSKLGINPIMMSAGELESGNAGEPAKLIRQRYREAADIIRKKGKMCCLFINDLDAGAGRMGGTTQYTVNNQMVNATLMNIADNPTNVQLPGVYNKEEIPRVPIIVTGNDFSTLYAPLIRDGRMEKFYWAPTREDRVGVCKGIFRADNVRDEDIVKIVDTFPGQSIDFFGALRARVYDDEVRKWVTEVGVDKIGKFLVNSKEGPPTFKKPAMTIAKLLEYGHMLVQEQENVKRVQLADKYLNEAALGDANDDAIKQGTFYGPGKRAQPVPATGYKKDPVIPKATDNLAQVTEVEEAEIKVEETSISGSAVVEKEESAVSVAEQSEQKEKPEEKEEEKPVASSATAELTTVEEREECIIAEKPVEDSTNQGVALVEKEATGQAVVAEQVEEETKQEEEEKEEEKHPTAEAAIVESETVTLEEKVEEGDSIYGSAVVEKEETVVEESANGGGTVVEKEVTGQAVVAEQVEEEKKQDEEEKEEEKQPTTEAAIAEPETVERKEETVTSEETVEGEGTNGSAVAEKEEIVVEESTNGGGSVVEKEGIGQAVAEQVEEEEKKQDEEEKQPTIEAAITEPETVECKVEESITLEETVEVKGTNGAAVVEKKEEIVVAAAAIEQVEEKKPIAIPEAKEKPAMTEKPAPAIIPAEKEDKKAEQGKQLSRQAVSKALKSLLSTVLSILKR